MEIIRSKRKTIEIVINPDGEVYVRAPFHASRFQIDHFLNLKRDWIHSQQEKIRLNSQPNHNFSEGEIFLFLGEPYQLHLMEHHQFQFIKGEQHFNLNKSSRADARGLIIQWYRRQARRIIGNRLSELAFQHNYQFRNFRLSSARTRWGSCSSKKNISITWYLIMAPLQVIDYVIIHELVHLEIQNHSKKFWSRLEEIIPNYAIHRTWLKNNGKNLFI